MKLHGVELVEMVGSDMPCPPDQVWLFGEMRPPNIRWQNIIARLFVGSAKEAGQWVGIPGAVLERMMENSIWSLVEIHRRLYHYGQRWLKVKRARLELTLEKWATRCLEVYMREVGEMVAMGVLRHDERSNTFFPTAQLVAQIMEAQDIATP